MDNFYGLPSGRVEWDEPFIEGAIREAKEEVGVDIKPEDLRHAITVHRRSPDTDWVDIYFEANKWEGEPFNAEPDKHGELAWLDLDNLPENIIPNVRFALGQIANGQTYAERGWAEPTQD
jgi:ADP-ribose pyrophosphatase YjhB (NUDIX family)